MKGTTASSSFPSSYLYSIPWQRQRRCPPSNLSSFFLHPFVGDNVGVAAGELGFYSRCGGDKECFWKAEYIVSENKERKWWWWDQLVLLVSGEVDFTSLVMGPGVPPLWLSTLEICGVAWFHANELWEGVFLVATLMLCLDMTKKA